MYDWTEEKCELRDKTVEDQRAILAKWVKDIVANGLYVPRSREVSDHRTR
jgi:hypothetical protein